MSRTRVGLTCCLLFVSMEAFQAVYLGARFQGVDSFLIGAWVFGISVVGSLVITIIIRPEELRVSFRSLHVLVLLNILSALIWTTYFIAIQLIEPAVVFTIFSGMVPLGTAIAAILGIKEARVPTTFHVRLGHRLIFLSVLLLAGTTVAGMSGFVRGGSSEALLGIALSAVSGGCTALVIVYSARLSSEGVGPLVQFSLRFVLYTVVAVLAFCAGVDEKPKSVSASEISVLVGIGLAVIAFPLYLVQISIPLLPIHTIASITALGPAMVFAMQLLEDRVSYAPTTLIGLFIYMGGVFFTIFGTYRSSRQKLTAHR